jgi:DNA repair ATPase RecN
MKSEFINYYERVQEHANDMVDEIYSNLIDDLGEYSNGISFFAWYSQNEAFLTEYNNGMYISLREAVDILEQSQRLCDDEGMYRNAGDCREQVKAMAYYTYRNDLMAEFKLALKSRLEEDIPVYEEQVEKFQELIDTLEEQIEQKDEQAEELIEELEMAREEGKTQTVKSIEKILGTIELEVDKFKIQIQKLEEEMEKPTNIHYNAEKFAGEL